MIAVVMARYGEWFSSTGVGQIHPPPLGPGASMDGVAGPLSLSQLGMALAIGVLMALAFQVLLTSLGTAIALSLALSPTDASQESDSEASTAQGGLGGLVPWGVLLGINGALFAASYLATRLAIAPDPVAGAIAGLVIWSAYLLLLLWLSTQAVGSVIGTLLQATTGGLRQLVGAIAAVLSPPEEAPLTRAELLDTLRREIPSPPAVPDLEAMEALIEAQVQQHLLPAIAQLRQEIQTQQTVSSPSAAGWEAAWDQVASHLRHTEARKLTPKRLERDLTALLDDLEQSGALPSVGLHRATPIPFQPEQVDALLAQRQDLSDKKRARIVQQVEALWLDRVSLPSSGTEPDAASQERSPSPAATDGLQALTERLLDLWPEIAHSLKSTLPAWTELAPLVLPLVLEQLRDRMASDPDRDSNSESEGASTWERVVHRFAQTSNAPWSDLAPALVATAITLRDRSIQQADSLQQAAQDQMAELQHQAQHQAERTRRTAIRAAWWLFMTASTGAGAAALAGAIACGLDITAWVPALGLERVDLRDALSHLLSRPLIN